MIAPSRIYSQAMSLASLPRRAARVALRSSRGVSYRRQPRLADAISQPCTFDQVVSPEYQQWCERLGIRPLHHRKTWEWVYILQVLEQHDMLRPGRRGLGFGVGNEPIAAYAASRQVQVVATDLPMTEPRAEEWQATGEHSRQFEDLNPEGICPSDEFARNVSFREVDMRAVPDDLTAFDFNWSSCAMEHLGSLEAGVEFFERQIATLRPGGVGVHTTEYNVVPDGPTLENPLTVMYQRPHLEELTRAMRRRGHDMTITFALGDAARGCSCRPAAVHQHPHPHRDPRLHPHLVRTRGEARLTAALQDRAGLRPIILGYAWLDRRGEGGPRVLHCPDCGSPIQTLDLPCPVCLAQESADELKHAFSKTFENRTAYSYRPNEFITKLNLWLIEQRTLERLGTTIHLDRQGLVRGVTLHCTAGSGPAPAAFQFDRIPLTKGTLFPRKHQDLGQALNAWSDAHPHFQRLNSWVMSMNGRPVETWVLFAMPWADHDVDADRFGEPPRTNA